MLKRLRESLRGELKVEGKVSRPVLFARLLTLLVITTWDMIFLIYAFTLLNWFTDRLVAEGANGFGETLSVIWGSITTILIAVWVYVKGLNRIGIWK